MSPTQILSILLFTTLTRIVVTGGLAMYAALNRTYPGFGLWVAGSGAVTLAFLSLALRPLAPGLSVVSANLLLVLGALLFLDGSRRFVRGSRLDLRWYLVAPAMGVLFALAFHPVDRLLLRIWLIALVLGGIGLATGLTWLRGPRPEGRRLYRAAVFLNGAYALALLIRALVWTFGAPAASLLEGGLREGAYFLTGAILDMAMQVFFLVANSQRLESDLQTANTDLEATLRDLQESRAQDAVLSGILPICSNCKQIQDGEGHWTPVEVYVRHRSEALFSHGLCPGCVERLYPDHADLAQEPGGA